MSFRTSTSPDFQERYDVLLDIGRVLTATLSPESLYRTIYEQASRVLETTGFFISLYDEEKDRATVVFYADRGEVERPGVTYRGSESRAIREGRAIMEDILHPDRAVMLLGPESDEEITRSVIAAPLLREDEVIGVLSAQSYKPEAYTESDLELLEGIAGLAAVAIANARAVSEIQRQRRESERMEEISRVLTASLDLGHVLERIVEATRELAEADGAGVWLLRDDGRAEIARTAGELALPVGSRVDVPPGLRSRLQDGLPVVIHHGESTDEIPPELLDMLEAESAIGVPLVVEDELIGALSVSHMTGRVYQPVEIRLLERFANSAAVAVANARLHDRLRTLSLTDPLTSLPNRRQMDIFLHREFAAAERGRGLTVILFDLDDFKVYNDTEGHQAGDAVLRRFGQILNSETRAMNLAARYGGDEFICILSETGGEGGDALIGRVLDQVRGDPEMGGVTVSAGLAGHRPGMTSPAELIRAADEDLYRKKAARRSRSG
ncbi:MAG: diguanylate cyclase [Longimicrobiales bacterium]|nr:diguanylate cyclase [Longimicrobiales bacterium]